MRPKKIIVRLLLSLCLASCAVQAQQPTATDRAVAAARAVMDEFMRTFNARNVSALADTLLFPHVRIASGGVNVTPDKAAFVQAMDMNEFARLYQWDHSAWDSIELIQADPTKVHFKVTFTRFNPDGAANATFNSLYILQNIDGKWGIRARSSFAP